MPLLSPKASTHQNQGKALAYPRSSHSWTYALPREGDKPIRLMWCLRTGSVYLDWLTWQVSPKGIELVCWACAWDYGNSLPNTHIPSPWLTKFGTVQKEKGSQESWLLKTLLPTPLSNSHLHMRESSPILMLGGFLIMIKCVLLNYNFLVFNV